MSAVPEVLATRCVRYRFRYSDCRRCAEACPHEAIRLSDEGAAIVGERCCGCGLCVAACRTETFATPSLSPLALIEKARGRNTLCIACAPSGADADSIVACLGALGPALLGYVVKQGVELNLAGSDHCIACTHGARGGEQLALNLDAVELLRVADPAGRWAAITLLERANARGTKDDGRRAARRGFFRRLSSVGDAAASGKPSAKAGAAPLRAIRAARVQPSAQRDLLQMLGLAEALTPLVTHPSLPVGDVRLEPGCTGCEACARACPTGALQVRENATAWALGFEAALCVGCGVCVETCRPGVLHLRETVEARHFAKGGAVALHGRAKRRCTRCDRSFIVSNDGALCDVCAGDVQDFDAIFG